MIDQLRTLLAWNISARDPFVLMILFAIICGMIVILTHRPRLYLPLVLFTSPLPKLFTVTQYEAWGNRQNSSGFSIADMVLAAGLAALIFRGLRRTQTPEASLFGRALIWWSASIVCSVFVGLALWPGVYQPGNALYVLRYLLTLASYAVAARYARGERTEDSIQKLLRRLAIAGNATVGLGIAYYFVLGSTSDGGTTSALMNTDSTVFRSYLLFFDYAIDMGYFAVTIAILNIILLLDKRNSHGSRIGYCLGVGFCLVAVLLLGERVNLLVFAASLGYFLLETSNPIHRSVRASIVFQIVCVLAVLGAGVAFMRIVAPREITNKLDLVTQNQFGADSADMMTAANVPAPIIDWVVGLPIGDFVVRLALSTSSLWFFFQHPLGVGFWGQLAASGWYAHHEIVTILVEQSLPGLATCLLLVWRLRQLLWFRQNLAGSRGQLGVLLRSISVGFFWALIGFNTVLLDLKYAVVYWSLVGVWSVLPRVATMPVQVVLIREADVVNA